MAAQGKCGVEVEWTDVMKGNTFGQNSSNGKGLGKPVPETLLDIALEGASASVKARVRKYVEKSGINPDEEQLLLLVMAMGYLNVLIEDAPEIWRTLLLLDAPSQWQLLFKKFTDTLELREKEHEKTLSQFAVVALQKQEAEIADSVASLIRQTEQDKARRLYTSLVPAAGLILGAMGVGSILTLAVSQLMRGELDPTGRRQLTLQQATDLKWASSSEGTLARRILEWNEGQHLRDCVANGMNIDIVDQDGKTQKHGLVYIDIGNGKRATYGMCNLWVVPPNQRKFEKKD